MLDLLTEIKAENWHIIEYIAAMAKLDLGEQEHRERLARCLTGHRIGAADSQHTYEEGASKGWRVFLKFVDSVCKDRALVESPGYDKDFHLEKHFFRPNAQFWVDACHKVFPCLRDVVDVQSVIRSLYGDVIHVAENETESGDAHMQDA
ncbi:hypothetical protein RQP46_003360 [Phenoliferia psychrophenolica]